MSPSLNSAAPAEGRTPDPVLRLVVLLGIVALLTAVMPHVHAMVYESEVLARAAVDEVSSRIGRSLDAAELRIVVEQFFGPPSLLASAAVALMSAIGVLLAGTLMMVGIILLGGRHTPLDTLMAAAWAAVALVAGRIGVWALLLAIEGRGQLSGLGWVHRGAPNLGGLAPDLGGNLLYYAMTSADITLLFGITVAAVVLAEQRKGLGYGGAILIASLWPLGIPLG